MGEKNRVYVLKFKIIFKLETSEFLLPFYIYAWKLINNFAFSYKNVFEL